MQPTNSVSDIVLLFESPIRLNANGKAIVIIDELTPLTTYSFISGLSKKGQSRIVKIPLNNVDINSVFSASVMRIELDGKSVKRIGVRINKDLQSAIARCTDDLLKTWGLDPQIQRKALTRSKPLTDQAMWITGDDYPNLALANDHEGSVKIAWIIGLDGRARDCKAIQSSGFVELDAAACTAITTRARYLAAQGPNGEPVISYGSRMVRWIIPQ